jgi:hypothetical protein
MSSPSPSPTPPPPPHSHFPCQPRPIKVTFSTRNNQTAISNTPSFANGKPLPNQGKRLKSKFMFH